MTAYRLVTTDIAAAVVYDTEGAWRGGTIRTLTDILALAS